MFASFMVNTWVTGSIVAVIAGVVGFFVVLRGAAFVADAVPQGAFAGAAGASLLGISTLIGLAVFALAGALTIGWLGRRARRDVATALVLTVMLGLGALFLSFTTQYSQEIFALLFGEPLGVSTTEILPVALLGLACILAIAVLYRPLLLTSLGPEAAPAPRTLASNPAVAIGMSVVLALVTVWVAVAASFQTNWPLGFFVGVGGAVC